MNKYQYTDQDKEMVKRFCNHIFWLKSDYFMFKQLFGNDALGLILDKTAPEFFRDLNRILQHYVLLEFAKITDRATTLKKDENFSVDNLIETIQWPDDIMERLVPLRKEVSDFSKFIKSFRNKLGAHLDKKTKLGESMVLGEFPEGEDNKFMAALEEICNIAHKACFGVICGDMVVIQIDLMSVLEKALVYDRLFEEIKTTMQESCLAVGEKSQAHTSKHKNFNP